MSQVREFDFGKYGAARNGPGRGGPPRGGGGEPLGKLFDRLPPSSLEAEMCLLGSMILDHQVIPSVLGFISDAADFSSQAHGEVFRAVLEVYDRHNSGDIVQIHELLRDRGVLEELGGPEFLEKLASAVPSAVNAPHYARIVSEKARLRRLIDAAGQILWDCYHVGDYGAEGAGEVIDRAEMAVFGVAQEDEKSDPQRLADLLQIEIDRIEAMEGKGFSGVPSGYAELDDLLRGFQAGEMVIVAARPSMGKTALALNLAEQVAFGGVPFGAAPTQKIPVGFFSLEMSKSAVTLRLVSAKSGISAHDLRSGRRISPEDMQRIQDACGELHEAPIYVDDTPGLTIMNLRARARRMVAQHGVKIIFVDYLQLLTSPSQARESRQVEVSAISRGIKALARELNIPIVCLSQLNRASEQREGNRPRMSDLRESGSIEQDADVIVLLHREEYYHLQNPAWKDENPDKVGVAELIVAKQRNGPTGVVNLLWDNTITRFKNLEASRYDDPFAPPPSTHMSAPRAAKPAARALDQGEPWAEPKPGFPASGRTGPVEEFRDGGGPERDEDAGDEPAPF